jgi:hypothetical protein
MKPLAIVSASAASAAAGVSACPSAPINFIACVTRSRPVKVIAT